MFPIASEETYQAGQVIFKEGSSGDWVYVILSGALEVYRTVGGKDIIIDNSLAFPNPSLTFLTGPLRGDQVYHQTLDPKRSERLLRLAFQGLAKRKERIISINRGKRILDTNSIAIFLKYIYF